MCKSKGIHIFLFATFIQILTPVFFPNTFAQKQSTIDSLHRLFEKSKDSFKVATLRQLSWEYRNFDTSKAIAYGKEALGNAIELNLNHEQADILGRLGVYERNAGNFSKAMDYYFKGLEIAQKKNYLELQAIEFNNIGDIYNRLGIYDQALDYVNKALNISIQSKDIYNLSYIHHMLGLIFKNNSMPDSALVHFKRSLKYRTLLNLKTGIASSYLNIGMIYYIQTKYDSSFIYYNRALSIFNQMNDKVGTANAYKCIGDYYNQRKEYDKALSNFKKSMQLIKGFGIPEVNKDAAEGLKYSYMKKGEFEKALFYQEFATRIKDSISNNLFIQKITRLTENYKFDIKNKEQEIIRKQNEKILNERINYQRTLLTFFIIAFLLMVILVGITIYFYRDKNNAYKALNLKNSLIEELNIGLTHANEEISSQKSEIESQRDILQEQSDKLTQLNLTKDKLFSIIAHDLRSPFNTIIGFSGFIKDNIQRLKTEEIEEMVDNINRVGINTFRVLENLLNWAKAQTHQVSINLENISISLIIYEAVNSFAPQAASKKLKLIYNKFEDIDVYIDQNMVNTILRNLISNSIKYCNPNNTISISVKRNNEYAEISIKDDGIGMSEEIRSRLFNSNVNPSTLGTANEKGTGLGLAICNEFVKKLNGQIWVESQIDKGSIFTFTLPLSKT